MQNSFSIPGSSVPALRFAQHFSNIDDDAEIIVRALQSTHEVIRAVRSSYHRALIIYDENGLFHDYTPATRLAFPGLVTPESWAEKQEQPLKKREGPIELPPEGTRLINEIKKDYLWRTAAEITGEALRVHCEITAATHPELGRGDMFVLDALVREWPHDVKKLAATQGFNRYRHLKSPPAAQMPSPPAMLAVASGNVVALFPDRAP